MEATENLKKAIENYLEYRAQTDELFAVTYKKPNKNLNDCITYILNNVMQSGCNGFTDDEIYSMAVDYYQEDNLDVGSPVGCRVVVNHVVELTAEEKEEARQEAIRRAQNEAYNKVMHRKKTTVKANDNVKQMSLF